MTDFTRSYEISINAPVHEVFEYCRDPRHLFQGWPGLEVTDVHMTPEGVGTTAHIVGTFLHGMMVEQIDREFTEFVPDEQIVSTARGTMRFAGRTKDVAHPPIFTWIFEGQDGATKLSFVVREEDLGWWQNLIESVSATAMAKTLNGILAAIKAGVEGQTSSAA
jgi:uncharacterized protein YndB with AHSA1/START domain